MKLTLLSLAVVPLFACSSQAPEAESSQTPSANAAPSEGTPAVDLAALAIPKMSQPAPGLLCAGQLTPEQMDALAEGGYGTFISLRNADENGSGWEEAHAAEKGHSFVRLAISGGADIDEAHARELAAALDAAEEPVVLYCGSSNRVGALLGLKAFHVDGKSAEEALAFGVAGGATKLKGKLAEELGIDE